MSIFEISAIFLTITAILAYINNRFIGMPTTIAVMVISLLVSIAAIFFGFLGFDKLIDFEVSLL
ncbi:sodium:proton antiporter, partial [Pseudoalteromonas undina]